MLIEIMIIFRSSMPGWLHPIWSEMRPLFRGQLQCNARSSHLHQLPLSQNHSQSGCNFRSSVHQNLHCSQNRQRRNVNYKGAF